MTDAAKDGNYGSINNQDMITSMPTENTRLTGPSDNLPSSGESEVKHDLPDEWDLNKVYETIGVGRAQCIFWVVSFLIAYSDYAELTLIALLIPYLRCEWDLSPEFEATLPITIFLVYAASALVSGKLSDIYGRRKVMSISIIFLIISAGGAALAYNEYIFLFWQSIAGACIGANFATVVVYSTEFSPNKYRTIGPLISLMGSYTSMFAVNLVGYIFINSIGWRWVIVIITIPVVPAWILLMMMPESPRYLCVSGQTERALQAVQLMAKLNKVTLPKNLEVFCHQNKELGSFKIVLGSNEYRKPAILLSIMYFCNIFIETALLVFLPLAFISQFCGSSGYAPERDRCKPLSQSDLWKLSGSAFGSLFGCMSAYFVAVCVGRLKPLRGSNSLQIVVFCLMFICLTNAYLFGVAIAIKVINAFVCMMIWLIVPESFPTMIRNTATGIINSSGKVGAVVGTAMVYLLFYVSPIAVIVGFLLIAALSCVCSFAFDKETNDAVLLET